MGALAAHPTWSAVEAGAPQAPGLLAGVAAALAAFLHGALMAPPLRGRDAGVRSGATLGVTLMLLGVMDLVWGRDAAPPRAAD